MPVAKALGDSQTAAGMGGMRGMVAVLVGPISHVLRSPPETDISPARYLSNDSVIYAELLGRDSGWMYLIVN
ncbi:MAG: hypothetical protein APR56_05750 [Methanosaeta sp. SDB]|uniref:Uncharacterized protein n=1 Tax=Methanothrix harundinacea TaxID=301375 RepID=A0A101FRT0_9EURY|nr:MAG: hypothetical protein APR56_05750 [Methanosaeta sp. SDB]KUK43282.1 MAG: hypothetical protein XD72_2341 [Methanothrix harundinacea]